LRTITRIPFPNTAGSARSNATSAKQSPPNASEIADHLGWVVNLHRLTRARQSRAQRPVQPGHADRVDQRDTTGLRHDTDAVRVDMDTRIQPIRFTLKVFLAQRRSGLDNRDSRCLEHFLLDHHAVTVKAPG
jgi:hypothetical protein